MIIFNSSVFFCNRIASEIGGILITHWSVFDSFLCRFLYSSLIYRINKSKQKYQKKQSINNEQQKTSLHIHTSIRFITVSCRFLSMQSSGFVATHCCTPVYCMCTSSSSSPSSFSHWQSIIFVSVCVYVFFFWVYFYLYAMTCCLSYLWYDATI